MNPFFVVGCARSGTTLLSVMLDGHPHLAVADELSFVAGLAPRRLRRRSPIGVEDVVGHPRFRRLGLDPERAQRAVEDRRPSSYAQLMDAVMSAWAAERRKRRWGEKTPGYLAVVPLLARVFPGAQFIHVIRDGRDVAAALAERTWGPPTPISGAAWWRWQVGRRERLARRVPPNRYLEVRLEELIADPTEMLARVCQFLGEPYDGAMLDYPARMAARNLPSTREHLRRPPTPDLRDWRRGLPARQQRAVESICHPLLHDLGYPIGSRSLGALVYGDVVVLRDLVRMGPRMVRNRLRPSRRRY